jgi:TonB family protein
MSKKGTKAPNKAPAGKPSEPPQAEKGSGRLGVDVAMMWSGDMLSAGFYPRPAAITLGVDEAFVLPEDVLGAKRFVLVEPKGDDFALRIDADKMTGHLIVDGEPYDVADVRAGKVKDVGGPTVPLTARTRAVVNFGEFTFVVSRAPVPPPQRFSLWGREQVGFVVALLLSALINLVPLAIAYNSADFRDRASLSYLDQIDDRIAEIEEIEVQVEEEEPEEPEEEAAAEEEEEPEQDVKPDEELLEKIREEEEKKIEEEADKLEDELKDLNVEEKEEKIKEIVKEEATKATEEIDKALEDLAPRTKLFALDDDANPDDPAAGNTTAGGSGDLIADLGGGGDLAGGANKNAKLFGDDAAKKAGDGPKKATKLTQKKVGFQAEKKQKVKVFGRGVAATGGLSPRIIKSYIRRKIGAIRACYQKGLQANPSLKGKVKVKFVIQPSGKVLGAKVVQSSLNSSQVEGCITRNIKSWKFPSSQGGEITTVTYPFVFSAR